MKNLLFSMIILITTNGFSQSIVDQHGLLTTKGNQVVDSSGKVFSISGNSLFWSNWSGEFYNADVVNWLKKDWKAGLVRVAVGVEPTEAYLQKPAIEI